MLRVIVGAAVVCGLVVWPKHSRAASSTGGPQEPRHVSVLADFVAEFSRATVSNASACDSSPRQQSGGVTLPGIFLHPVSSGDSVVAYEKVAVPSERAFLVFHIGLRDKIPWESGKANGVRFSVVVAGEKVFEEERAEPGWAARAVDMTPWGGREVGVEFRTNAIEGNTHYDWSLFGKPLLITMPGPGPASFEEDEIGLALIAVRCAERSTVVVRAGTGAERAVLAEGLHWIPVHWTHYGGVELDVEQGAARIEDVSALPFDSELRWSPIELSSPLVIAGQLFDVSITVENLGPGLYTGAEEVVLEAALHEHEGDQGRAMERSALGAGAAATRTIGRLTPGEKGAYRWSELRIKQPCHRVTFRIGPEAISFHVFPPEPTTPESDPEEVGAHILPKEPISALAANAGARLWFVTDDARECYAIAETWNGTGWQRLGSLYPLAELRRAPEPGEPEGAGSFRFCVESMRVQSDSLLIEGQFQGIPDESWPVSLRFTPGNGPRRIAMECETKAPRGSRLAAFYGPVMLAGDRAFGATKDFAIFPGLEYLEGDEESSSERDLIHPLSDRRVPAVHKIAAPVMAVQGGEALVALLWDIHREWADGEKRPAARFLAPKYDSGIDYVSMSLFAPSVGKYVGENQYAAADQPYPVRQGETLSLRSVLVLDHRARYAPGSVARGPHPGGLVLEAMRHYYEVYGFPEPSPQPRDWEAEKALCRHAYANAVWQEDPPGWRHCAKWDAGLLVGHAVPQLLDIRDGAEPAVASAIMGRVNRVLERAVREQGGKFLWRPDGCHIVCGQLPFYYGYVPESMRDLRDHAFALLNRRENGKWVWHPASERHAPLGLDGGHTLGQAARSAWLTVYAARLTGDGNLAAQALDAMKQMELYEVPRGAQMWECPMFQPDILAAAYAIRAYCEAYRITGDPDYLDHARYWGWTGLPFLYAWELEGYPTMRYNVISVIGSTFFTHSWLGLPVVWCGLVYAYAVQDLAEFDDSLDWRAVAQGITNSTMWQQYAEGPHQGCYPDSWNMVANRPNPADINPENILVNEFRLRGLSPEVRFARINEPSGHTALNSAADILRVEGSVHKGRIDFSLKGTPEFPVHTLLAPVPEPVEVEGAGTRADSSTTMMTLEQGWLYDCDLRAVVLKTTMGREPVRCHVRWR